MKVEIPQPRAVITQDGGDLIISIPTKKNLFTTLFLTFWLGGWGMGEVTASREVFLASSPIGAKLFIIFWLGAWTVGGGFAIYTWFRSFLGREVILINPMMLTIRQEAGKLGRSKEYELREVKSLRVEPLAYGYRNYSSNMQFWGMGNGLIAFDYGAKTFRFGSGVEESEAKDLVNMIRDKFKI